MWNAVSSFPNLKIRVTPNEYRPGFFPVLGGIVSYPAK
jgi:hypothetical protein